MALYNAGTKIFSGSIGESFLGEATVDLSVSGTKQFINLLPAPPNTRCAITQFVFANPTLNVTAELSFGYTPASDDVLPNSSYLALNSIDTYLVVPVGISFGANAAPVLTNFGTVVNVSQVAGSIDVYVFGFYFKG